MMKTHRRSGSEFALSWVCLMATHRWRKYTQTHKVLAQINSKMAALIELISIFGQSDIYTPL